MKYPGLGRSLSLRECLRGFQAREMVRILFECCAWLFMVREVGARALQELRVFNRCQPRIATEAQETAHNSGRVVVIDDRAIHQVVADRAFPILLNAKCLKVIRRHAVSGFQSRAKTSVWCAHVCQRVVFINASFAVSFVTIGLAGRAGKLRQRLDVVTARALLLADVRLRNCHLIVWQCATFGTPSGCAKSEAASADERIQRLLMTAQIAPFHRAIFA